MKILIIHASAGAGHTKAAEALSNGLKKSSEHQVQLVDSLDYTNPFFKKVYRGMYIALVTRCSLLWGFFFSIANLKALSGLIRVIRRLLHMANAQPLEKFLKQEQFDCVLSTHFLSTEVLGHLKSTKQITSKVVTCITDYDVHPIWVAEGIDLYAVATDFTKQKLIAMGVSNDKIRVTGIPTDERFAQKTDKIALRKIMEYKVDAFTVLVATGSFGMGPIEKVITALSDFQVLVVCGHNKRLYDVLSRKMMSHVKVMGLVNNMEVLMAVSDVMITKPGGLSISEALVSQLPMIFFSPIPGQETNNIKVLKTYGIGMSNCTIPQIVDELRRLRDNPDIYVTVQRKTQKLAKPYAVHDILALLP